MMIPKLIKMLRQWRLREDLYSKAEYWDWKASQHQDSRASMWANTHLNALYRTELTDVVELEFVNVREKSILDIGCGTGEVSRYFAVRGATVVGTDFSPRAIEIARAISGPNEISYRVASVLDLRECANYDIVFSLGCLTVAASTPDDLLLALRNLRVALRSGGRILLVEPIHRGFLHRVLNIDTDHFCEVMVAAGFRIVSIRQLHFWPLRLVLGYVPWPNFVTKPLYHLGQFFLKFSLLRNLGDYKAISAIAV